jgi:6-phosphogluconolactonase
MDKTNDLRNGGTFMTIYTGFVGTYTKKDGKGIHTFELDTEKAELLHAAVAAEVDNSTYITISENEQFLYAVEKGGKGGGLAAFSIDNGKLHKLNDVLDSEGVPCHVSLNKSGTRAFTAQYHTGTAEMYSINAETGELVDLLDVATHEGTGPNLDRQEKAHTHFFGTTRDERFVIAVDLGTDEIITYEVAGEDLLKKAVFKTEPGAGPRHIVFHPKECIAYVMTELSNEVLVLAFDEQEGHLSSWLPIKRFHTILLKTAREVPFAFRQMAVLFMPEIVAITVLPCLKQPRTDAVFNW